MSQLKSVDAFASHFDGLLAILRNHQPCQANRESVIANRRRVRGDWNRTASTQSAQEGTFRRHRPPGGFILQYREQAESRRIGGAALNSQSTLSGRGEHY